MVATALAGSIGAGALVEFDSHVAAGRASSQVGRAEAPRGRHSGSRYHRRPVSCLLRPGGRELRLVLGRIRVDRRASRSHGARSLTGGTLLLDSEPQDLALAPALPLALERRHRSSFSFVVLSPCSHCNLHRRGGLYSLASAWHAVDSVEVPLALSIAREFARGCVSIVLCECRIVCSVWYSAPNDLSPTILESLCDSSTSRSIDIDIPNECIYSLKLNKGVPRLVYQEEEEEEEPSRSEQMTNNLTNLQVFKSVSRSIPDDDDVLVLGGGKAGTALERSHHQLFVWLLVRAPPSTNQSINQSTSSTESRIPSQRSTSSRDGSTIESRVHGVVEGDGLCATTADTGPLALQAAAARPPVQAHRSRRLSNTKPNQTHQTTHELSYSLAHSRTM